jgi:hypothetical protein
MAKTLPGAGVSAPWQVELLTGDDTGEADRRMLGYSPVTAWVRGKENYRIKAVGIGAAAE